MRTIHVTLGTFYHVCGSYRSYEGCRLFGKGHSKRAIDSSRYSSIRAVTYKRQCALVLSYRVKQPWGPRGGGGGGGGAPSIFGIVFVIHSIIHGHCITIFVWPTRIIGSAGVYTSLCIHLLLLLHILKFIVFCYPQYPHSYHTLCDQTGVLFLIIM